MAIKGQPVEVLSTNSGVWLKAYCWSCGVEVTRHIIVLTTSVPWQCNICDVTWETSHRG